MFSTPKNQANILIKNAQVYDGYSAHSSVYDVAIINDKIVATGQLSTWDGDEIIDATGLELTPGFIDVHTHDDLEVIRNPKMLNKLSQGVTTVIVGNCGISASPFNLNGTPPDPINLLGQQSEFLYSDFSQYVNAVNNVKPAVNVAALIGHTSLRVEAMDDLNRSANEQELKAMSCKLKIAMQQGAKGLSSGLAYTNAKAAKSDELKILASQITPFKGLYTTHLRTEFNEIIDALDESFQIARKAKVELIISHLKCAGKNNWGRAKEILAHIEQASITQPISFDSYPYSASSSTLDLEQVNNDSDIFISWSTPYPELAGQTLEKIAIFWKIPLLEAAKRLQPAGAVYHCMDEMDVQSILSSTKGMIGSDGLPCDPHPHPRLWGCFPRVLRKYVRELHLFSLNTAIRKMTGLSAKQFKISKRGMIRVGYFADLVLFDSQRITDRADYLNPIETSEGIIKVWVNGKLSYQEEHLSPPPATPLTRAGCFLLHE